MTDDLYWAHISPEGRQQTVQEHLLGTARRCGAFAAKFGEEKRGFFLGYAHDIGKCSEAFQRWLHGGPQVDHTAGALECAKAGEDAMACCVVGHHGGLPDFGNPRTDYPGAPTCAGRIKKGKTGGIPACHWDGTLPNPREKPPISDPYALSMWVRMLYSCLVDADYLDTEAFMSIAPPHRDGYDPMAVLLERLNAYIAPWFPGNTELNKNRCAMLSQCLEKASQLRGLLPDRTHRRQKDRVLTGLCPEARGGKRAGAGHLCDPLYLHYRAERGSISGNSGRKQRGGASQRHPLRWR